MQPCIAKRPFPNTYNKIHIFNDQLSEGMTSRQVRFAATHYDGTQKMRRSKTRDLRRFNSRFLVLHYRLGEGLGNSSQIINGDSWVPEWPETTQPEWFYQYGGADVYYDTWGWYFMDLDNSSWRTFWTTQVLSQLANNENDGLFADSYSVPNYFGGSDFTPDLPDYDVDFENEWSTKLEDFARYTKNRFGNEHYLISNVGHWVTTRDRTSYLGTNGVMIEGFGAWDATTPFALVDWKLQMNRILGMQKIGKVIIAQSYLDSASQRRARMFFVSNYLLVKDTHTYINMDMGYGPEWFREYGIRLGRPIKRAPSNIRSLYSRLRVFRRVYSNGWALVNPTSTRRTVRFGRYLYNVTASGGGFVDGYARANGKLYYRRMNRITLAPYSGAVVVKSK